MTVLSSATAHLIPLRGDSSPAAGTDRIRGLICFVFWSALLPLAASADRVTANAEPGIADGSATAAGATGTGDMIAPLDERFQQAGTEEVPDFQKHVIPLLGKLGCNGRACHGSFQGRGGFQLSLFGYDFKADYQALLDPDAGRVLPDDVDESLILVKPTDAEAHEGGKRYEVDSWQHHVLRRWVAAGTQGGVPPLQRLERLQVTPQEIQFSAAADQVDLRVIAHWQDGTREDVTLLCRFAANDESIATIDESGQVTAVAPGDTHVVVFYDNEVVPIPVLHPFDPAAVGSLANRLPAPQHPIDRLVEAKLDRLGIQPSELCSDAEFLRRASLDVSGILPAADEVRKFLADDSPDKRQRLVDQLLESPGYAAWWATRFSDWTGNNQEQLQNVLPVRDVAGVLWHHWLRTRIGNNVPYDQIVEGIVSANSRQQDETYREYCETMSEACRPGNEDLFAARDGLAIYWARRDFQQPEDRAIGFAYTFLGVRIECAQCHKHPFDRWSKADFENFSRLFSPIRANANSVMPKSRQEKQALLEQITDGKELKGGKLRRAVSDAVKAGKVVPFGELLINTNAINNKARQAAKKQGKQQPMRIPSGQILGELDRVSLDSDTRPALMDWLRSPDNPYFAKAIVNRIWSNYFGIGIVDPTDDMNLANPPSNGPLLDYLATEFIRHEFDLKWLHRTIISSDTYQRSAEPNATNVHDRTNFSRHVPRRLPAEVLYDAVVLATGSDKQAESLRRRVDALAIADSRARRRNRNDFALTVFGQSIRESNCDCDRSDSPSLLQSIYLRNDRDMYNRLTNRNGWVNQACQAIGAAAPEPMADDGADAVQQRAENIKSQIRTRLKRYLALPEQQQAEIRPQLVRDYNRSSAKLESLGYTMPPLDQLVAAPDQWDQLVNDGNRHGASAADQNAAQTTVRDIVEQAYLRTLSRFPDPAEIEVSVDYINASDSPAVGVQSLLWALVNTKEFIISH